MSQNVPDFETLLRSAKRTAVHLEMRDVYAVPSEAEEVEHFRRTGEVDDDPNSDGWSGWVPLVRETVGRGVVMRRARVVSEPVTVYTRFLHASTPVNEAAGEQVRWLPRRSAYDLALPLNDFWLIDDRLVCFHFFTGDGSWATPGHEVSDSPTLVKMCAEAFEVVWNRATPHARFTV